MTPINAAQAAEGSHNFATTISDVALAVLGTVWFWLLELQTGLVTVEPGIKALGSVVILFILCVRAWIAVKDLIARYRRKNGAP